MSPTAAAAMVPADEPLPLENAARRPRPSPPLWQQFAVEALQMLRADLLDVEEILKARCDGIADPLPGACRHLVTADGKRLRPILALLGSRIAGVPRDRALRIAAASELVHSASLLHDDVLDDGTKRRGKDAARVLYGNRISVLGGNHLLVGALLELTATKPEDLASVLGVLDELVEGEVLQHNLRTRPVIPSPVYQQVVARKTASLIEWSVSAAASGTPLHGPLSHYGYHLGVSFQMVDDLLDVTGDAAKVGKNLANDVKEGKPSLPLVVACELFPEARAEARRVFALPEADRTGGALTELFGYLTHEKTLDVGRRWIQSITMQALTAIRSLPASAERDLLERATLALENRLN